MSDNAGAAAKISLLAGNVLQAFEFTLQLNIRSKSPPSGGAGGNAIGERLFSSFFFYLMETRSLPENGAAGKGSEHLVQGSVQQSHLSSQFVFQYCNYPQLLNTQKNVPYLCISIFKFEVFKNVFQIWNDSPPHLSHDLQIKILKRK